MGNDEHRDNERSDTRSQGISRRTALGLVGAAAAASLFDPRAARAETRAAAAKGGAPVEYTLPPLPYATNALDGFLSAEILELHHDKHHAGYVKGLNGALASLEEARKKGDFASVKPLERAVAFHGSGHVLHTLYWSSMSPSGGGDPTGDLGAMIDRSFGGIDGFRKQLAAATKAAEASGWGILAYEPLGNRLITLAAESHEQMGFQGSIPLLVCDVWEHAYYLRYKSDRGSYVDKFQDVIDWGFVAERLARARA